MDSAIPEVIELAVDKITDYVQIENIPFAPGRLKNQLKAFFRGWHVAVASSAFVAFVVLVTNIIIVIWATVRNKNPVTDGVIELFSGDCGKMQTIFTWTHIAINVLSTMLLAASNTACQILCSPTRKELDAAHGKGHWLDLGVPSFRNLRFIASKRLVVYILLALSSIPLHLIYNSILFPTTTAYDNLVVFADSGFLKGRTWDKSEIHYPEAPHVIAHNAIKAIQELQDAGVGGRLRLLGNTQCVKELSSKYVSTYRNFVVETVQKRGPLKKLGVLEWITTKEPLNQDTSWICKGKAAYDIGQQNKFVCRNAWASIQTYPKRWEMIERGAFSRYPRELLVKRCYAEPVTPSCTVSLSRSLLLGVIGCNFLKLLCFLLVVRWAEGKPLVTVGDAIESFLQKPDPSTIDLGPISALDVRKGVWNAQRDILKKEWTLKPWPAKRHFWYSAAGWKRWTMAGIFALILYAPAATLPYWAYESSGSWGVVSKMGTLQAKLVLAITANWSIPSEVVFVNLPQLILSTVYVFYNNILTSCLQASECCNYSRQRKGLRVTSDKNFQRSTYWLQVPYRYALPQMACWIVLHWLVSQSIFLAQFKTLGIRQSLSNTINGCAYSQSPILMVIVLVGIMLLALCILGFRRYPSDIPLMSSCSIAIAAACHTSEHEGTEMATLPLKYGVLKGSTEDGLSMFRRVGFSSLEVEPLEKGEIYR